MFKGAVFVFLGACSFGVLSTFMKLSVQQYHYTIGDIVCVQAFLGMLVLWFIATFIKKEKEVTDAAVSAAVTPVWKVMLAGISTGLSAYLYYLGVNLLPASVAIVILMNYTWMCLLIELLVYRKKPTPPQLVSVALVLAGTLLAGGLLNDKLLSLNLGGVTYVLCAAFVYAVSITSSGRVGNELHPIRKSALFVTGSTIFLFILLRPGFLFDGSLFGLFGLWGLFFAVFGTIIPPIFFAVGIPRTGVGLGAIMTSAELPVAVLASSILLHEQVTAIQWGGIVLILSALILPNLKRRSAD